MGFMTARREAQEALAKQEALLADREKDLEYYRECLKTFKAALEHLEEETPEVGSIMQEMVLRYTIRVENLEKSVNSIRVNIADIRRTLRNKYSLAPAIR